jgi:4-carboxymuconolactone decarboxylase
VIMDERERYQSGLEVRRAVLGNAHVDRTLQKRNAFNEDFQEFLTRYAWGEIWTRPGLPRQTRSMLTVALLVALGRDEELRMHLKAALRNGVSREELQEVLMHTSVYCGLPAANAAFRIAEEVLASEDAPAPAPLSPNGG